MNGYSGKQYLPTEKAPILNNRSHSATLVTFSSPPPTLTFRTCKIKVTKHLNLHISPDSTSTSEESNCNAVDTHQEWSKIYTATPPAIEKLHQRRFKPLQKIEPVFKLIFLGLPSFNLIGWLPQFFPLYLIPLIFSCLFPESSGTCFSTFFGHIFSLIGRMFSAFTKYH